MRTECFKSRTTVRVWICNGRFAGGLCEVLSQLALLLKATSGVRPTQGVLENLQDVLLAMQGVESSGRVFVVTGNESYAAS